MPHREQTWEPDPAAMGDWEKQLFERRRGPTAPPAPAIQSASQAAADYDDADVDDISRELYRPWRVQRGRSQSAMMLGLHRYDRKAGLWRRCAIAYHSLFAVDVIGDRVISLDFHSRQYVLEGQELDGLARHLQQGTVLSIVEYSSAVWPSPPQGPLVSTIRAISADAS